MDDADRASIEQEREQEREYRRLLDAARRRTRARSDRCIDCGDELTEQRQEYGLCVPCATAQEQRSRTMGGRR